MEIGDIKKDEIPVKKKAMSQCLVFVEKCVPKKFCDEYYGFVGEIIFITPLGILWMEKCSNHKL